MVIAICHNETSLLSLTVSNITQNHLSTLLDAHLIDQNLALTNEVKDLIILQIQLTASSKELITAIQNDTKVENSLVKSKDVYYKCVT